MVYKIIERILTKNSTTKNEINKISKTIISCKLNFYGEYGTTYISVQQVKCAILLLLIEPIKRN